MILTRQAIIFERGNGNLTIDEFNPAQVNPNSYNYRLGKIFKEFSHMENDKPIFSTFELPNSGYCLKPGQMYLGHTEETLGSNKYAMSLIGRSSVGRLGLFLQVSANLGHTTSCHQWTLEIVATNPVIIYPGMVIGQISFWSNSGDIIPTLPTYANFNMPHESVGV